MGIGLAIAPHPLEIFRPGQSKTSLHPRLTMVSAPERGKLPTSPLDVLVHFDSKLVTALQAAALEDGASVGGCHAGAEAMHAHAAADFGLIRSLGHSTFLFLEKMITQSPVGWVF